jgi:ubiquinone/menaquinone biosynthesis C-methylase UbiE
MNYFSSAESADRYAVGRPDFHRQTMQHLKDFLKLQHKVERALDIACGNGLSSKALLDLAKEVFATDSSVAMLQHALMPEKIHYSMAEATNQPFENHTFDLITVCSAIHWFDQDKFLHEAKRIIKPNGWLVLYDNFFSAEMAGEQEFKNWYLNVYLPKFPPPARNSPETWLHENIQTSGFILKSTQEFTNSVNFNLQNLVLYFTTQSNITAIIARGEMTYVEVEAYLQNELSSFFAEGENRRSIQFGNWIKYLQPLT